MKILAYGTKSSFGHQKMESNFVFREHMRYLHSQNIPFKPFVLVKLDNEIEPKWMGLNSFRRLQKMEKEEKDAS